MGALASLHGFTILRNGAGAGGEGAEIRGEWANGI
jgi:hypothetical protein